MKEIGGYIGLDDVCGTEYHNEAIAVNSGRHALEYLIRAHHIEKLLLPSFLCTTIQNTAIKCGCKVETYEVGFDFLPAFDGKLGECDWLFLVNYYGQLSDRIIRHYKEKYERVIVDCAQAFFQKPVDNTETIYTCRKFFGVPDGGYVYSTKSIDGDIQTATSYQKMGYIVGSYELTAADFYEESVKNNYSFDSEPLQLMSKLTHRLLKDIDYEIVRRKREANYTTLHQVLKNKNQLKLVNPIGPYMYPFYHEKAEVIRQKMIKKKIYIPILWPDILVYSPKNSREYDLASHILPLPVDQRYGIDEMEIVLDAVTTMIAKSEGNI